MEHLLCECMYYLQLLWIQLGEIITLYLNNNAQDHIPRVEYGQLNIIYNVPHTSFLLHSQDKLMQNQIKSNIYFYSRQAVYGRYYCKAAHYMIAQTIIWYVLYKV
jgi:hypothetical protein